MNNQQHYPAPSRYPPSRLAFSVAIIVAITGIGFGLLRPSSTDQPAPDGAASAPLAGYATPGPAAAQAPLQSQADSFSPGQRNGAATATRDAAPGAFPQITSLWDIGPSSRFPAADVERYLNELARLGEAALPRIRAFLQDGKDAALAAAGDSQGLGRHRSLRLALFDVLRQIGGPQAESLLAEELQYTADPLEVATLARFLDEMAPGGYQEQALQAAREIMAMAWRGELPGRNMTPLFEVFRDYGDPKEAASTLKQNLWKDWGPSALVALAEIDQRAGVPLLTRMARSSIEDTSGGDILSNRRLLALQMLAQLAGDNRNAVDVLLEQASMDRIPDRLWPKLAAAVAGYEQLQIQTPDNMADYSAYYMGDHVIYASRGPLNLTSEQVDARVRLLDQLHSVAVGLEALQILENAKKSLIRRANTARWRR